MSGAAAAAEPSRVRAAQTPPDPRWSYVWVVIVLIVGAVATAGLAIISAGLAASNERHLLKLRSREVGAALTSSLADLRTPLSATAAVADMTDGDPTKLMRFADQYLGPTASPRFVSISVWRVGHLDAGPVMVAGARPELASLPGGVPGFLQGASTHPGLRVYGMLHAPAPRLGYAYSRARQHRFIVYAEQRLPAHRYTELPPNSAYSNLDVSVYLGRSTRRSHLLLTTVPRLPLPGAHAETQVPFAGTRLAVVVSARQLLGGSFPTELPWGIGIVGALLTIGAAVLTARLISGRRGAQQLAGENSRLYDEQHEIAQRLQHALLPDALPSIAGMELAARYAAGAPGVDIGGDWYDLIPLGDGRLMLVVGDVSGRGLPAVAAMTALRFAIHYAARIEPPETFLPKLSTTRSLQESGQLATVLCVVIDLRTRRVSVTSAGHLPPLMAHGGRSEFLQPAVGPPIGAGANADYVPSEFLVPPGATLFGYTDGLVERRHEPLDTGLERLREVATETQGDLEATVDTIVARVRSTESVDDLAIAGVRWTS